jgi:predicted GNAT family N-acyltransferase
MQPFMTPLAEKPQSKLLNALVRIGCVLYEADSSTLDLMSYRIELCAWPEARVAALDIRIEVFVREQGVPMALEHDEWDERSDHALAFDGTIAVATGRLLPDGHIGRMAVRRAWRGQGVGGAVLERMVARAIERELPCVVLHAQLHAADFYRRYGFVETGVPFMEAGIPHIAMTRECLTR